MKPDPVRYLWVYSAADEWTESWHQQLIDRRRRRGYDVAGFCITPEDIGRRWYPYPELDERWRVGDPGLLRLYAALAASLRDRDVLILYNGANLHPEFTAKLDCMRVYTCGDDPESTEILSKPLSPPFHVHLVNHPGMVDAYRSWGCGKAHFWPLGSQIFPEEVADLDEVSLRDRTRRDVVGVYIGEKNEKKAARLDRLAAVFPHARFHGNGWSSGRIDREGMTALYRRSMIGWNVHNTSGPINFRLYDLAAFGCVQICDNSVSLRQVYSMDECRGFDVIEDAIAASREIIGDLKLQADMAVAARLRWEREYSPDRVWDRLIELVGTPASPGAVDVEMLVSGLAERARSRTLRRFLWRSARFWRRGRAALRRRFPIPGILS